MIDIKSKREIELMKEACRITALAHKAVAQAIKPGVSTLELDKIAEKVEDFPTLIRKFFGHYGLFAANGVFANTITPSTGWSNLWISPR